tara:strand:+ start:1208 stop:1405 length:198 start_codon:yes stop_codon:yes gene_type:complete
MDKELIKNKLDELENCVNDIFTMDEIHSIILDSVSISSFTHLNDKRDLELFIGRIISYISHKGGI